MALLSAHRAHGRGSRRVARADVRQIAMPDMVGVFGQRRRCASCRSVGRIEQAEFHVRGMFGEQRKIDALAIPRSAKRIGTAWPDSHPFNLQRHNVRIHGPPLWWSQVPQHAAGGHTSILHCDKACVRSCVFAAALPSSDACQKATEDNSVSAMVRRDVIPLSLNGGTRPGAILSIRGSTG